MPEVGQPPGGRGKNEPRRSIGYDSGHRGERYDSPHGGHKADRPAEDRRGGDRTGRSGYVGSREDRGRFENRRRDHAAKDRDEGHSDRRPPSGDGVREKPRDVAPGLPDGAEYASLDHETRRDLGGLPKQLADEVGAHLAAAGMLIDIDPERALVHARFARRKAARVAVVREAVGLTAYHAGEWAESLAELRAVRRMAGQNAHLAVMADCERALGRPERALELAADARGMDLPRAEAVELRIVAAGARRDMGQLDAAVVSLQGPELDPKRTESWVARLCYAYADNLAAAGRTEEAVRWFLHAAQADVEEETDAGERAIELAGGTEEELDIAALVNGEQTSADQGLPKS